MGYLVDVHTEGQGGQARKIMYFVRCTNSIQGESGGLGLGYVDSVPSQDNLRMREN